MTTSCQCHKDRFMCHKGSLSAVSIKTASCAIKTTSCQCHKDRFMCHKGSLSAVLIMTAARVVRTVSCVTKTVCHVLSHPGGVERGAWGRGDVWRQVLEKERQ